jgi:hypothetical protein
VPGQVSANRLSQFRQQHFYLLFESRKDKPNPSKKSAKGWATSSSYLDAVLVEAGGHGLYYCAVSVVVLQGPDKGAAQPAGGAEIDVAHL